jgi:hypothetical protein
MMLNWKIKEGKKEDREGGMYIKSKFIIPQFKIVMQVQTLV